MTSGTQLGAATWTMAAIVTTLVVLRLYTRIKIVAFLGTEDYLYATTGIFFVAYAAAIHVSVHYGLGISFWSLSLEHSSNAIFWTYVANTFAIVGNAIAKLSMAFFLLRVVQLRWHKIALWVLVSVTASTSSVLAVLLWNQTTPVRHSWDPLRTKGTFRLSIQELSVGLGAWSSAADFFFGCFPWLVIWSLRMPRRDKAILAGSMSLGVLAGVCGIVRTVVLARLNVLDYTLHFVPYFAWAGAEIAVGMVCLGIPTLRPLYLKATGRAVPKKGDVLPQFTIVDPQLRGGQPGPTIHQNFPSTLVPPLSAGTDTSFASRVSSPYSSPDSVQAAKFAAVNTLSSTMPARPPRARVHGPPGSQGTRGICGHDSVDEILGLYGQNQNKERARIRKEMVVHELASDWPLKV